ncbi:MAG: cyclic nucleotide-binding domain-containing protein [Rhodospirillales bacterium]|jgi:CRP-like cAMP-binding protein|nr:cyclic nucleotide-binding domain-containing protein [Rhodospirillales bacterium]
MSDSEPLKSIQFATNDVVFHKGDVGDAAYMVTKGEVEIRRGLIGYSSRALTTIQRGGTFGELALCLDSPRTASAIATKNTEVIAVSQDDFLRVLEDANPVVKALVLNLGKRIVELTDELEVNETKASWRQWQKHK